MARPIKKGIDYFPLDVSFLNDMKIRKIRKACGDTAITMLIYLLSNIYRDEGYFMNWDDDVRFLVADDIGTSESAVTELLNKTFKVKFFDKNLFDKYHILTSHGIQTRYQKAAYKKVDSSIKSEYSLISDTENVVSDTRNLISDDRSTQRKEDESRGNESNKDSHNSKHDKRVYEADDINFKLAQSLLSKIEEQNPDHKKPDLQKWANDIRLMHEQDNRSYDKIQKMIDWSQNNDFWSGNVLSAAKLRKQYDTMAAQANSEVKGKTIGYRKKSGRVETGTDWDKVKARETSNSSNELKERLAKIRGKQDATN